MIYEVILYSLLLLLLLLLTITTFDVYKKKSNFFLYLTNYNGFIKIAAIIFLLIIIGFYDLASKQILIDSSIQPIGNVNLTNIEEQLEKIINIGESSKVNNGDTPYLSWITPYYFLFIALIAIFILGFVVVIKNLENWKTLGIGSVLISGSLFTFTFINVNELGIELFSKDYFYFPNNDNVKGIDTKSSPKFHIDYLGYIGPFTTAKTELQTNSVIETINYQLKSMLDEKLRSNINIKTLILIGVTDRRALINEAKKKWGTNKYLAEARAKKVKLELLKLLKDETYQSLKGIQILQLPYGPTYENDFSNDRKVDIYYGY
jgi:hypothetical protein